MQDHQSNLRSWHFRVGLIQPDSLQTNLHGIGSILPLSLAWLQS